MSDEKLFGIDIEYSGEPPRRVFLESIDQLDSKRLITLYDYWNAKRGTRPRPRWDEFDLMEIHEVARFIHIRDVIHGGEEFVVRYWGTGLTDALGYEGTGKAIHEMYNEIMAKTAYQICREVLHSELPILSTGNVIWDSHKSFKKFISLILPLDGTDMPLAHILTGLDFVKPT